MTETAQDLAGMLPDDLVEDIARLTHEANLGIQLADGDPRPSGHWGALTRGEQQEQAQSVRESLLLLAGAGWDVSVAVELDWRRWAAGKLAGGWVHGPEKDPVKKTHPCLVGSYAELPPMQRVKDYVRLSIIATLSEIATERPREL